MAIAPSPVLVDVLREATLLDDLQLAEVESLARQIPDAAQLGTTLVQRGWLTAWQLQVIAAGQGTRLALGNYVLLEVLGEGTMGRVYKARQRRLKRVVALKVMHPASMSDEPAVQRFVREAEAVARLNHPNIIQIYDSDEVNGVRFLAMEFAEGTDLAHLIKDAGALPVGQACELIRQTALGLQHAHEQGLVHRDVKPSNLLVTPQGIVKVLDLGLARLTETAGAPQNLTLTTHGAAMGTPAYLAPEQAMDARTADARSDIYSLGCTLYHLLAGRPPFLAADLTQMITAHLVQEAEPLDRLRGDVPGPVAALVRRMIAKRPEERCQSAAEVAEILLAWCMLEETPAAAGAQIQALPQHFGTIQAQQMAQRLSSPLLGTRKTASSAGTVRDERLAQSRGPRRRRGPVVVALCCVAIAAGAGAAALLRPEWRAQAQAWLQSLTPAPAPVTPPASFAALPTLPAAGSVSTPPEPPPVPIEPPAVVAQRAAEQAFQRGKELQERKETDRALAEYTEALRHRPDFADALFQRGLLHLETKQYNPAITDFDAVIKLEPTRAAAFAQRANAHREARDPAAALRDCAEAIRLDPKQAGAYHTRALIRGAAREYDQVVADCDEAIRLDPVPARPYDTRGRAYLFRPERDLGKAIENFTAAIRLEPTFALAHVHRGVAYRLQGDLERALPDFNEALRLDPNLGYGYFCRGQLWENKKDWDQVIADQTESIRCSATYPPAFGSRAYALVEKREYARAVADCTEALRLDPQYAYGHLVRGNAHRLLREHEKALADLTEAIRLDPRRAAAYSCRGQVHQAQKDFERAIQDFTEAIRLDPKYGAPYYYRGLAYNDRNEYDKAVADLSEAIRQNPTYPGAHQHRGAAHLGLRNYDKAVADATEALRLAPRNAAAYRTRGNAYAGLRQYDKAVADLGDAIRLEPKNWEGFFNRGNVYFDKREWEIAIADFTDALALNPELFGAFNNRGLCHRYKNDYDKAIADFTDAYRINTRSALALNNRGEVYRLKKEPGLALADFSEALRLAPDYAAAFINRASVQHFQLEKYASAIDDYTEGLRLNPRHAGAHAMFAWLLATCPDLKKRDGKKAVAHATTACELTGWKVSVHLDTLAAGHAQAGNFKEAVRWATKAIELNDGSESLTNMRNRLKLYQAGKAVPGVSP